MTRSVQLKSLEMMKQQLSGPFAKKMHGEYGKCLFLMRVLPDRQKSYNQKFSTLHMKNQLLYSLCMELHACYCPTRTPKITAKEYLSQLGFTAIPDILLLHPTTCQTVDKRHEFTVLPPPPPPPPPPHTHTHTHSK